MYNFVREDVYKNRNYMNDTIRPQRSLEKIGKYIQTIASNNASY